MEHEDISGFLPDGVDEVESAGLDATWRMLGAIDSPAPDTARMRARLDAVVDEVETAHAVNRPPLVHAYTLQGLAAAAMLVIGIGIGWFAGAGQTRIPVTASGMRAASEDSMAQIAAMRNEMHDLREMVSLSLMQQQSASERLKG